MTTRLRLFLQIQQTLYMSHSSTFVSLEVCDKGQLIQYPFLCTDKQLLFVLWKGEEMITFCISVFLTALDDLNLVRVLQRFLHLILDVFLHHLVIQ